MKRSTTRNLFARRTPILLVPIALACLARELHAQAQARVSFSIEYRNPTKGLVSTSPGTRITEGDILVAAFGPTIGAQPAPSIPINAFSLGLNIALNCTNPTPGVPCRIEVDGISYGHDARFFPPGPQAQPPRLYFSVDEWAVGAPGSLFAPNVRTEAPFGDASADIFTPVNLPSLPAPPGAVAPNCVGVFDGNGLLSGSGYVYPGLGLIEPNPPTGGTVTPGDNIDALAIEPLPTAGSPVYFSLDAGFVDPLTGLTNTNSAVINGFLPGAILVKILGTGGPPTVYATPADLGLDLAPQLPASDDLDALIVAENGVPGYQRSSVPFDWLGPNPTDMVLFSVRRGSGLIGKLDSQFGIPIEEGDVLTTGPIGQRPRIFIAAENLGLRTHRSNGVPFGDELDALAATPSDFFDCNHNGIEDSVDIANGASPDTNHNGIPDECERNYVEFCECPLSAPPPCGNDDPAAGCRNSTGMGAHLGASGTSCAYTDDLVLTVTHMPPNVTGLWLMSSSTTQVALGDGLRCVNNPIYRFGVFNSGGGGGGSKGPGIVNASCTTLPPGACIDAGQTWNFQVWYRNVIGPCGNFTNLTNAEQVTFSP